MRRPMIALSVLVIATLCVLTLLVKQSLAKQVAEKPDISDQRATVSRTQCRASSPVAKRIIWIVRGEDGSVKSFGVVLVRKCSR